MLVSWTFVLFIDTRFKKEKGKLYIYKKINGGELNCNRKKGKQRELKGRGGVVGGEKGGGGNRVWGEGWGWGKMDECYPCNWRTCRPHQSVSETSTAGKSAHCEYHQSAGEQFHLRTSLLCIVLLLLRRQAEEQHKELYLKLIPTTHTHERERER